MKPHQPSVTVQHRRPFDWAVEKLFPGERAERFAVTRERYGHSLQLVLFGRRLIVDVSHK